MKRKNKCLSMSLYGEKVWYYIPLLFNMDLISRSGFDYDIVIRAERRSKEMLERILEQEDIQFNNDLVVMVMERSSTLSRGMFWRYHEVVLDRYDYVMVQDVDNILTNADWDVMDQFIQSGKAIGTFKHLSCNSSLLAGGRLFFDRRQMDSSFLRKFAHICTMIDKEDIINYGFDQDMMQDVLDPYMKSGEFVLYEAYRNRLWSKYNTEEQIGKRMSAARQHYANIVDLSNYEFRKMAYKNGWYFNDFCKGLKNYDFDSQTYILDGVKHERKRNYSGTCTSNSYVENKQLVAKMRNEFNNDII